MDTFQYYRHSRRVGFGAGDPPWILNVTGHRKGVPAMLFLYDLPGEDYSDRQFRAERAEFLGCTDGLLVLIDPEPYLVGKGNRQTAAAADLRNRRER